MRDIDAPIGLEPRIEPDRSEAVEDISPPPSVNAKIYHYDLDLARGVLMALGVVLHSANVYGLGIPDAVGNDARSWFFTYLDDAIHLFRMPAFFMISGYFCVMSLHKYAALRFVRSRAKRLLIPFAATALTFNIVEHWVRARIAGAEPFAGLTLHDAFLTNTFIYHLWFLPVLFVFSLVATLGFLLIARAPSLSRFLGKAASVLDSINWIWLTPVLAFTSFIPYAIGHIWRPLMHADGLFGLKGFTFLEYAPYFALGTVLYFAPRNFESLRRLSLASLFVFAAAVTFVPLTLISGSPYSQAQVWLSAAGSWATTLTVFGFFAAATRQFHLRLDGVADTSYTIYVSHHLLVTLLGAAFVAVALPIGVEFLIIVAAVTALCVGAHYFIVRRSRTLTLLFNGK